MSVVNESIEDKMEFTTFILLDVAGTTTKLDFVKKTLFPYFEKEVKAFVTSNLKDEKVTTALKQLQKTLTKELDLEKEDDVNEIIVDIIKHTKEESNAAEIKALQGMVYKKGYESGDLKGHVFPDVATSLPLWAAHRTICIYSTGSVDSQKYLFSNTTEGDLSKHIKHYFDQTVGIKTDAGSYVKIADELKTKPAQLMFLTDNIKEGKAAKEAGLIVILVEREGNDVIAEEDQKLFFTVKSFLDLEIKNPKRKIEEVEEIEVPPSKVAKKDVESTEEAATDVPKSDEAMEVCTAAESTEQSNETKADSKTVVDAVTEAKPEKNETDTKTKSEETTTETEAMKTDDKVTKTSEADTKTAEPMKTEDPKEVVVEEKMNVDSVDAKKTDAVESKKTDTVDSKKTTDTIEVVDKKIEDSKEPVKVETEEKKENKVSEETKPGEKDVVDVAKEEESTIEKEAEEKKPLSEKLDVEKKDNNDTVSQNSELSEKTEDNKNEVSEKENNGDVANGVVDSEKKENGDVKENGEKQNGDLKENGSSVTEDKDTDIKVKKIDAEEPPSELSVEA